MTISLIQSNGSVNTGTLAASPPAWGTPTTLGNLLIMVGSEQQGTNGTWPTLPAGYSTVTGTAFQYNSAGPGVAGIFYRIAAGSDATPGAYGETSSTQNYETYTYEFHSTTGWLPVGTVFDTSSHSAATTSSVSTLASGSTATLAQADELVIGFASLYTAGTALAFTSNALVNAIPSSGSSTLQWFGWTESAATTAQGTTASWTTGAVPCVWVATFKAAAPAVGPSVPQQVYLAPSATICSAS